MELGIDDFFVRFIPEVVENYNQNELKYHGRVDIKVVSENWFRCINDYYIIECKRLDGSDRLNQKYIDEGVCRFVIEPPKYISPNNRGIMFGIIVSREDISSLSNAISKIETSKLKKYIIDSFVDKEKAFKHKVFESKYSNGLYINHLLYDFSEII